MNLDRLKKIANMISPIIKVINAPLAYFSGKSDYMEKGILWPTVTTYSNNSRKVIQYTTLPKNVDNMAQMQCAGESFEDIRIVLQGPVLEDGDFTLNTVKMYNKYYPKVKLVVSTWIGLSEETECKLREAGADVVLCKKPEKTGAYNINLQLTSAYEGVKMAQKLGCSYALKTRTDQRLYANDVLKYFQTLLNIFPSSDCKVVNQRLIFTTYGKSFRYLPFNLCDFLVYGETSELLKLYGIQRDNRASDFGKIIYTEEKEFNKKIFTLLEGKQGVSPYDVFPDFDALYKKYMFAEYYIVYNYFLENIASNESYGDLMDAYYSYLKKYAVVADSEKLLLYWPKYVQYNVKFENELDFYAKLDSKKWMDIYANYTPFSQ